MSKEGLQLAARFAWSAKACSDNQEGKKILENCVVENKYDGVETILSGYKEMMFYLSILAREMQKEIFSKEVVSPYWLGGDELNRFSGDILPFHLFKVLREPGNPDDCMVRWGPVTEIGKSKLIAVLYSTGQKSKELLVYPKGFLPGLKNGDIIAAHGGIAVKILTPEEETSLDYWTKKALRRKN